MGNKKPTGRKPLEHHKVVMKKMSENVSFLLKEKQENTGK